MTPEESFKNMGPIAIFIVIGLRIVAIPIGIGVAIIVRRISPMVTSIIAAIFAGYIVGFVILFYVIWQVIHLHWYDAASISLVVTAAIVFYVSYVIKRRLFHNVDTIKDDQVFNIFGEPVKGKPKIVRRRKR